jgi:transcriptional regulator with XRE-family HTH domain
LLLEGNVMSNGDTFGARMRAARERRGISLDTIASVTNVRTELWEGLERNDVSQWPAGLFARSFVRDYARAIGLDETGVVNEFCRTFPVADRRTLRILAGQARIIGHELSIDADSPGLPPGGDRRAPAAAPVAPAPPSRPSFVASAFRSVFMRRLRPSR